MPGLLVFISRELDHGQVHGHCAAVDGRRSGVFFSARCLSCIALSHLCVGALLFSAGKTQADSTNQATAATPRLVRNDSDAKITLQDVWLRRADEPNACQTWLSQASELYLAQTHSGRQAAAMFWVRARCPGWQSVSAHVLLKRGALSASEWLVALSDCKNARCRPFELAIEAIAWRGEQEALLLAVDFSKDRDVVDLLAVVRRAPWAQQRAFTKRVCANLSLSHSVRHSIVVTIGSLNTASARALVQELTTEFPELRLERTVSHHNVARRSRREAK